MSWQATDWALNQQVAPPARKLLLLVLATYADPQGICWPSQESLAKKTGMSLDSIQRHTKKLKEVGLMSSVRPPKRRGQWQTLVYQLNISSSAPVAEPSPDSGNLKTSGSSNGGRPARYVSERHRSGRGKRPSQVNSIIDASDRLIETIKSFDAEEDDRPISQAAPRTEALGSPPLLCGSAAPHPDRQPDRTALRLKPSLEPSNEPSASILANGAMNRLRAFQGKQESVEVTQNRIARRLGYDGWLLLGELTEAERERLTALERRDQLDDDTLNLAVLRFRAP